MILRRIVLKITRSSRLVTQTEIVKESDSALPVTDERIPRRRAVDIILSACKIPHEVPPVHPVHLIIKEERKILEERRLLMFGTSDHMAAVTHI